MLTIDALNPDGMHKNPAFSQAIRVRGMHETLFIGGQNAVGPTGEIVGIDDVEAQARQVARNINLLLEQAGATPEAVVLWNVSLVAGQDPVAAMRGFQTELGYAGRPATVRVLYVVGLAHPDFLLEIDAIAVLPASDS